MDLVYYTHPAFFEPALCLVKALSRHVRVHLLLEISSGAWQSAMFDVETRHIPPGIVPADPILAPLLPGGVRAYWQEATSFHLVVHATRKSFSLPSWRLSAEVLRFAHERAQVLHADDVDVSPRLALGLTKLRRMPLVISVHDPQPHSGERNWRKDLARRMAFPRASAFVLYNAAWRDAFAARHRINPDRIAVTRLGVYDIIREWVPPSRPVDSRTVLFFGRLSPYKGLDVFYEAAPLIAARAPGARFVVAGRPIDGYRPPTPPALPGGGRVEVIDRYLPAADAAALLRDAAVVVCPYRDASQSGVVLSAFAFDTPVVATAVGGLPEYVVPDRTGLLVPVGNAPALADAVSRIIGDRALAARLRDGIHQAAAGDLGWDVTARALTNVYARVSKRG